MSEPAGSSSVGDISIAQNALKPYMSNSNDVLELKLVRKPADLLDEDVMFHPEMTHQIFGENEIIFGYRDLRIKLYCSAAKLTTYLSIKYSDKVNPDRFEGVEGDDVEKALAERLAPGYLTNIDDFTSQLEKDSKYKPPGELIHSFTTSRAEESSVRRYEVYTCDISTPGFRSFHERLQVFLLLFVDASSYIDIDDDRWRFFTVWEKYNDGSGDAYAIGGYATVYEYYAYPEHLRPRISQMLILPTFQKQGVGTQLLDCLYKHYIPRQEVLDITVEDPSEEFIRLRDFVDVRRCKNLDSFKPEKLQQGFSEAMVEEAKRKYKITKRQTRRVYEILKLAVTNISDPEEYKQYRLEVKNRLNQPFEKNKRDFSKLQKSLKSEELQAVMGVNTAEQRLEALQRMYQDTEEEYKRVLERIN